jgi:drug/metabolite transporter (DMT)-like permease
MLSTAIRKDVNGDGWRQADGVLMHPIRRVWTQNLDSPVLTGAAAIFCGVAAGLSLKMLVVTPASQALVERSVLAALAVLGFILLRRPEQLFKPLTKAVVLRASLDAIAALTFALAVFELPLALLTALHLSLPILTTLLAVPLLGERMGRLQWAALGTGFLGVLIILQPSLAISGLGLVLALVSTLAYGLRDIVTRRLPPTADTARTALLAIALIGCAAALVPSDRPWSAVQGQDWVWVALSALFFLGANLMIVGALRRAGVARIAPLRYTAILWAILFDLVFFGLRPGLLTLAGGTLIVLAGIMLITANRRARTALNDA